MVSGHPAAGILHREPRLAPTCRAYAQEGSFLGDAERIARATRLDCKICWCVYDSVWQVPPGTAFADLPGNGCCPTATGPRSNSWCCMTDVGDDPAPLFEATFQRIADEHMAGLPILNPALAVAAVGFRPWQDYWIGVLVTPWFMNLMARPVRQDAVPTADTVLALPSGEYEFMVSREDGVGVYLSCPLISPMAQFTGQDAALAVAREVMVQIFGTPEPVAKPEADLGRRGFLAAFLPADKAR